MPVYRPPRITTSEITPHAVYLQRREFLAAGAFGALSLLSAQETKAAPLATVSSAYKVDEKPTPREDVTTYNNFYEFGLDKADPAALSGDFKPLPWTIKVDGMVSKPSTFDVEQLMKEFPIEERTYRMRCVEGWSMVIPWNGFPLAALLNKVEPLGSAKYVAFETVVRPEEMPGQKASSSPCRGPTSRGFALTKRGILWRFWPWDYTGKRCRTRTARQSGLSYHGSMASKE